MVTRTCLLILQQLTYNNENMKEDFLIPMDDAIADFRHHLDTHDRTILSARFGDGKSFFLSHFMEDSNVNECYTFLTIFPVNYQVTENRDIFDLIKRDILLQMLLKGVIETEIEINDDVALALYLQNQPLSFAESFLPLLSELAMNDDAAKVVSIALAGKKFFKSIKQGLDKIRKEEQSRDSQLDTFLNSVEKDPVVGRDAISSIIQQCLQQYRDKYPNKRVVLVIEDLDRIDPAHLFRILNIFSAHIDFCYRLGCQPDKSLAGNKFGLDKVVFVMDYANVKHLYSHFYGVDVNFEGYIEKFCSSNHYSYSFQEEKNKYFIKQIGIETEFPADVLNCLVKPEDFKEISVRKFVQAIDNVDKSIIKLPKVKSRNNMMITFHPGILRLIVISRKLEIEDRIILSRIEDAIQSKEIGNDGIFPYVAQYIMFVSRESAFSSFRYSCKTWETNYVSVQDINQKGMAICSFSIYANEDINAENNLHEHLKKLFRMAAG